MGHCRVLWLGHSRDTPEIGRRRDILRLGTACKGTLGYSGVGCGKETLGLSSDAGFGALRGYSEGAMRSSNPHQSWRLDTLPSG